MKFRRKVISKIVVGFVILSLTKWGDVTINAGENNTNDIICVESKAANLVEGYDENSDLCQKLEYDVENNTTELSDEVEENLNQIGILDEEISDLDDETIEQLNNSINTQVYISYMTVDDANGECRELNQNEIDNLICEQIEDGKLEYEDDEKTSIISFVTTALGITPTTVKAAEPKYEDWKHQVSSSGAVKQTVYACQFKKKGTIYVTAKAIWLKEAHYRNKDVYGVSVSRADIIPGSYSCKHTATYRTDSYYNSPFVSPLHTKELKSTTPNKWVIGNAGDGIAYTVNLFGDRSSMVVKRNSNVFEYYDDETIQIKFRCKYSSKKDVKFVTHYKHSKTNKSITPSISVSSGGLSVGISGSSINYYEEISRNAYLLYNHI